MQRLKKHYDHIVEYDLLLKHNYTNSLQIPKLQKIVLNTGLGKKALTNRDFFWMNLWALELITSQKAIITRAKKSIDQFKLREDSPIGCKVTLRNDKAYAFLDRLIHETLVRDDDVFFDNSRTLLQKKQNVQKKNVLLYNKNKLTNKIKTHTGFGIQQYWLWKSIQYNQFDSSLGIQITFVVKPHLNNSFLTAFQLPL